MDVVDVSESFHRFRSTGDRSLRNQLVERHEHLAIHCARRFRGRGEPFDDLLQVARLGVLKAVERYQPDYGTTFATFAVPTILGELRRHFRDTTWGLRVSRTLKDRYLEAKGVIDRLHHQLGRAPSLSEVAADARLTVDELLQALEAGASYRPVPLVPPTEVAHGDVDDGPEGATLGVVDTELDQVELRVTLDHLAAHLEERERTILHLRFQQGLTQSEIAATVGVSQVHVSRLLRQSLDRCRSLASGSPTSGA